MATPTRTSMRTRRSKRPVSPPVEEKRKKKTNLTPVTSADILKDDKTTTPAATADDEAIPKISKQKSAPAPPQATSSTPTPPPIKSKEIIKASTTPPAVIPKLEETVPSREVPPAESTSASVGTASTAVGGRTIEAVAASVQQEHKGHCFKDPNFVHSSKGAGASKKSRAWKTLKQISAAERSMSWQQGDVTYSSLEAPPSFKPAKKYSDLSGFEAKYTDPHTKLRYATTEEFSKLRMLPQDIVTGLLALRKANTEVA